MRVKKTCQYIRTVSKVERMSVKTSLFNFLRATFHFEKVRYKSLVATNFNPNFKTLFVVVAKMHRKEYDSYHIITSNRIESDTNVPSI